ncbi:MAG: hypothetical protein ACRET4_01890, partial [Steroidobacteraceae bacterium]
MKRSEHRILTTHVGSITRPPEMLELASYAKGPPVDPVEYRRRTRLGVENVVRRQAEIGLDIINDGEYGKLGGFSNYVRTRLSGYELKPLQQLIGREQSTEFPKY